MVGMTGQALIWCSDETNCSRLEFWRQHFLVRINGLPAHRSGHLAGIGLKALLFQKLHFSLGHWMSSWSLPRQCRPLPTSPLILATSPGQAGPSTGLSCLAGQVVTVPPPGERGARRENQRATAASSTLAICVTHVSNVSHLQNSVNSLFLGLPSNIYFCKIMSKMPCFEGTLLLQNCCSPCWSVGNYPSFH